ncbi:glycine cleavage system protein GcvH [Pararhizobium sp. IMCC21322]|uniref:glycine cleavage system protein GcvH n=1 Tax=Pararhizobium sp. IMCC21322 TaxID=3067903 RepID=UPI002740AB04|nr:glycine cleavage system protein GcvH [Pararhizobium sp. IMCC21322]
MSTTYYTEEHEWLRVEGDVATVGITNHAQEQLGDLVFVDLPTTGTSVEQGDDVVVVESVKAASDVYAPASGEIVEINETLANEAALVNADAEGGGWLYKMKLSKPDELEQLLDLASYTAQIS